MFAVLAILVMSCDVSTTLEATVFFKMYQSSLMYKQLELYFQPPFYIKSESHRTHCRSFYLCCKLRDMQKFFAHV